jgi:prolipoprotein diacylglyceryl transferase
VNLAAIPSPTNSVWHLGPIPLRAYAACIVAGIVIATLIMERRMRARGAPEWVVLDIAVWAVPAGIIGARIYHVITDPELYFGAGRDWVGIFEIWNGGLGIWGAVAGGALGAWAACRRRGIPLTMAADALAPGLPVAQAIGRWGNYFNQELFGGPTKLPWALEIDPQHRPLGYEQYATYHPTFLYESLWDLGVALAVWLLDRRYRFGRGRAFALYAMLYVVGRFWTEMLRIDEANHILGLRLNDWVCMLVFLAALLYFVKVRGPRQRLVIGDEGEITVVADTGDADDETSEPARAAESESGAGDTPDAGPDGEPPNAEAATVEEGADPAEAAEERPADDRPRPRPSPRPTPSPAPAEDADKDAAVSADSPTDVSPERP